MSALQADVDILLSEVEQERRITAELEKMVRAKDKTIATLEKKLAASEDKVARLKGKNKKVEEEFEYEEMIEELKKKVSVLTQSQTQLIESLDASADELDRMSKENKALCDAVERLKDSCDAWEKQVQENIALSCRLKDLLEEGSQWIVPKGADGVSIPRITKSHRTTSEEEVGILREEYNNVLVHYKALEGNVSQWQTKCADLEIQVMALCAEINRLHTYSSSVESSIMPILTDIESKLQRN
jgi:chromosome segregation ATPase